ncbi:hypothetical protein LEP1GSC202_0433 [Leptospira yanagawae serovar Saopaulo str. Sao Paulo = ATCC 700523]|uniref:Uncharacterized protein n=2 Tax=Leptospira yanagawae TaxID=293069 RepID=A0A5E8HIC7_9LEPT|nr:hypothetical protein LEP1GSC202_0433 [Leptospira yanagawae serovar Saopaulo str. Sao Paulo = ATCC 700523]
MPMDFDADDLSIFLTWVETFQIQSGMNDNEEFAGRFFTRILNSFNENTPERNLIKKQNEFLIRGLYSGYDGIVPKNCTEKILTPLAKDLIEFGWSRKLNQVKLKFGELRFYIPEKIDILEQRIENAMFEWGQI